MNRKHTILLAVMVNAGLLVVLFITALTTQEELISPSPFQMADSSISASKADSAEVSKPLFGDLADEALRLPVEVKPSPIAATTEPPTGYPLPPLAPEPVVPTLEIKQPTAVETPIPAPDASGLLEIVVKKGDSLDKLAKEYHTSVSELIKINRLPSSFLRVGQLLKVPAQRKAPISSKPAPASPKEEETITYYTVKVGDNPWTIAMKHNMKVEELLRLNGLNEEKARKLKPGDRLRTKYTPGH